MRVHGNGPGANTHEVYMVPRQEIAECGLKCPKCQTEAVPRADFSKIVRVFIDGQENEVVKCPGIWETAEGRQVSCPAWLAASPNTEHGDDLIEGDPLSFYQFTRITQQQALKEKYGKLDILVHAVAFAPATELRGEFINTTREGFKTAMDVSVYSLVAVSRGAVPLMTDGGSIMTMSYYAAEKVVPNYNVMAVAKAGLECTVRYLAWNLGSKNIRVNAISAGPIKTLAARGVGDLTEMMRAHAECAPLHRNVDQLEVGGAALFLASDLSSAMTGEIMYVDCGYNIMGF